MSKRTKSWLKNALRWGIAVFGIWYVLNNMSWSSRVLVSGADGWPVARKLASPAMDEFAGHFKIFDENKSVTTIPRTDVLAKVDSAHITVKRDGTDVRYDVLAQHVSRDPDRSHWQYVAVKPRNLWQRYWNIHSSAAETIDPSEIVGEKPHSLPYPLIEEGIGPMLLRARTGLLIAAVFVFPSVFFIVAYRWHLLLKVLDIRMTYTQTFVLNMVGSFYNTFMPGSTGGDVLKAYYVSKLTPHRTRAVMSVIVDRVIGLLALVMLGGVMSTVGAFMFAPTDPARQKCIQVSIASLAILLGTAIGLLVFYSPTLRRVTGLNWLLHRLPMQRQVQAAIMTMEMYRERPGIVLSSILMTLPVHSTVVVSAMLAGMALIPTTKLHPLYYWVVVPVTVLSGSVPISPQGLGVMEGVAFVLIKGRACTMNEVLALTMSIRVVQILWNLTGGIFVLRGGFHAPTDSEQKTMGADEPDDPTTLRSVQVSS